MNPYNGNVNWNPNQMPQPNGYTGKQHPIKQYTFVSGVDEAKAYPVMLNQNILLMDEEASMCYQKTTDTYGKPVTRYFKMEEVDEATAREFLKPQTPELNFASKTDIDNINKKLDELFKMLGQSKPNKNNKDMNNA